jgi:hypothetical protein
MPSCSCLEHIGAACVGDGVAAERAHSLQHQGLRAPQAHSQWRARHQLHVSVHGLLSVLYQSIVAALALIGLLWRRRM